MKYSGPDFGSRLETLLISALNSGRAFKDSGITYHDIFSLCASIADEFKDSERPVCVCSDDRAVVLAALLSSMCGGPEVILPYSFSDRALEEMRMLLSFNTAICDMERKMPAGVTSFVPVLKSGIEPDYKITRDIDEVFVRLFTGGSTARPRVWSKTPANLFGEALYLSEKFDINQGDIILSTAPPYHIYGLLFSVLLPVVAKATVVDSTPVYPHEIIMQIADRYPTVLVSVPPHYRSLNGTEIERGTLRLAFSSAGALGREDSDYFVSKTDLSIHEIYGSTETGGIAQRCVADGDDHYTVFDGIECRTSDAMLCVKSSFISPELPRAADGYFQTADRVELFDDGRFNLLGRADGIVKVGGKRVDLLDIQSKVRKISGIRNAVVFSMPVPNSRENEVALLYEGDVNENILRAELSVMLEPYAMPRRTRAVEKIPVSSSGKYDRRKLEELI